MSLADLRGVTSLERESIRVHALERLRGGAAAAQAEGVALADELKVAVHERLGLVDSTLRHDPQAARSFLDILRWRGRVGMALRPMHEAGFLGRYLPEFGRVTFLVQHDFFHRYNEHTLRAIEAQGVKTIVRARLTRLLAAGFSCALLSAGLAQATPSTTFWTPMTLDMQAAGIVHIGVDNYFTVGKRSPDSGGFPTDAGLTLSVLPFQKLQLEVGVDYLGPSDDPFYFNAKLGSPEGTLFKGAPALQAGLFNAGTKKGVTNQNILYAVVGRTLSRIGRISAGPYVGNGDVLRNGAGEEANSGWMVAFDHAFVTVKKDGEEFSRWVLAADWASGRNAIGGGGVGLYYYFTRNVSLLTGPVWFNDQKVNGRWKWTIQLDVNHPRAFGK